MRGIYLGVLVVLAACVYGLINVQDEDTSIIETTARVIEVDNDRLTHIGSNKIGEQQLILEVLKNEHKGQIVTSANLLSGSLEYDEYYEIGDKVLVALNNDSSGMKAQVLSHYRLNVIYSLLAIFSCGLILYARKVGFKSLLSFFGSLIIIWNILIPSLLAGMSPLTATIMTVIVLSALIIFAVAGFSIKAISAFTGTILGLVITTGLCVLVSNWLHLDGMSQPLAQVLLFETGMHLNMLDIYFAAVIIGASGAAMDVAMEMAAAMEEVKLNTPKISRLELLSSGFRVGSAVIGTMTTTLLLAYSGGFLTLIMLFISRDTTLIQMINMKLVSAEVSRTLIGSISMVLVAPMTAWIAAWLLTTPIKSQLFFTKSEPLRD